MSYGLESTTVTTTDESLVDRARRLFTFLGEAQQLKNPGVTDLESYKRDGAVHWLCDLPPHPSLSSALHGAPTDPDAPLLTIDRVARHAPPEPRGELADWVNGELDDPRQPPTLRNERYIRSEAEHENDPAGPPPMRRVTLDDYPEVPGSFDAYLIDWRAWADQELRDEPARILYNDLFSDYHRVAGFPEQLEFVLGTGLLAWVPDGHPKVRRHLLTVPVTIELDTDSGRMTVVASDLSNGTRVELDMLDPGLHGNAQHVNEVRVDARNERSHPLDRDRRGELARRLAHVLSAEAEYRDDDDPVHPTPRPIAAFAPALILRRRSQQGLVEIFRQIVEQITASEVVPDGVRPLIDPDHIPEAGDASGERTDGALVRVDDDPFLPLPVNDVQLKILRQVDSHAQTLIQGPPGTGKTHTAAVLISHLLAQGKRILVTAHTDRALKEVREKLPEPIRPLAVAVVGSSREDMSDLRVAVQHIATNASEHDSHEAQRTIDGLLASIDELRRRRADVYHRLIEAREREVRVHDVAGYHGTLASIATERENHRAQYDWIEAYVQAPSGDAPLSNADVAEWRAQLLDDDLTADEPEAAKRLVDLAAVAHPHGFADMVAAERQAMDLSATFDVARTRAEYAAIERTPAAERTAIRARLAELRMEVRTLSSRSEPWVRDALHDVRNDRAANWAARHQQINELISHAQPFLDELGPVVDVQVQGESAVLVAHAEALLTHVEAGGSVKLGPDGTPKIGAFTPRVVKQAVTLFDRVKVDGCAPTSSAQLRAFLTWVQGARVLDALDRAWPVGVEIPAEDTLQERMQWHLTELDLLARVVGLSVWVEGEEQELRSAGLPWPNWSDDADFEAYAALPEAADATEAAEAATQPIVELSRRISAEEHWLNTSEVVPRLLRACRQRDVSGYTAAYERLERLHRVRVEASRRNATELVLRSVAPDLAAALRAEPADGSWAARLAVFAESWSWASVGSWIAERAGVDVNALQAGVIELEDTIRKHVQDLSATRAWSHAVDPARLSRGSRADLEQYARLVRQFGKTGGQYRDQRKADIRDAMDRCRPAVPVWIMPLYRIADQLRIKPNMFDVVIVDEASQAGVEGTFLQYLAPRIVVIGDDKQVSPSAVGINRQQLRDLANQYLFDDKYRATWQEPQQSLFDEAKMRFSGMLTLVEHRRCVPEIIGFSNQIAYEPDNIRLIPVRQFGADRLEPIRTAFIKDGYERGGSTTRTNPPEAEAIVSQIEKCLQDPQYDGKTFGVISLLGSTQARLIERLLQERIPLKELIARDLRCGDAADFQGSERDVMFLSMVVSTQTDRRIMALTKPEFVQRYNVAASRAKDQMWLYHSVDPATLGNAEDMRRQLLDYCYGVQNRLSGSEDGAVTSSLPEEELVPPFDSRFEQRVCNRVLDRGFTVIPQFESIGYRLDLVVVGAKTRLAIECDGDYWHGPEAYQRDMGRQRELERCGWHFFRVLESDFNLDPAKTLAPLWQRLEELEIHPAGWSASRSEVSPEPQTAAGLPGPVNLVETIKVISPPIAAAERRPAPFPADESVAVDVADYASGPSTLRLDLKADTDRNETEPTLTNPLRIAPPPVIAPRRPAADPPPRTVVPPRTPALPAFASQSDDLLLDAENRTMILTAALRVPLTSVWVADALAISKPEARTILRALADEGELQEVEGKRGTWYARPRREAGRRDSRADEPARQTSTYIASSAQRAQVLRTARHKPVTTERVRLLLSIDSGAASDILTALVVSGELERRGQGPGTYYRVPRPNPGEIIRKQTSEPATPPLRRIPGGPAWSRPPAPAANNLIRSSLPFPFEISPATGSDGKTSIYAHCNELDYHSWDTARPIQREDGPAHRCTRCGGLRVLSSDKTYRYIFRTP